MSTPHVSSPDYHGRLRALSAEVQQKIDIAVLRERERCAKIADNLQSIPWPEYTDDNANNRFILSHIECGWDRAKAVIAHKIREGK